MGYALFVMWDYLRNVLSDQGGFGVSGVLRCDRSLSLSLLSGQRSWGMGKQVFGDRFVWDYTKGRVESLAASFLWGSRCDL